MQSARIFQRCLSGTVLALSLTLGLAMPLSAETTVIKGSPYAGKKIVVSMQYDWEPLSYLDDAGKPTGYFYDITAEAAKRLGAEIEITSGDFAAVIPAIQSGKFDASVGLDLTPARLEVVDAVAHTKVGYRLLALKSSGMTEETKFEDLCGKTISLLASHPAETTMTEVSKKCVADGRDPVLIAFYPDRAAAFLAMKSGRADVTASSLGQAGWLAKKNDDIVVIGPIFDAAYAGIPVAKGSPNAAFWKAAVDSMIADGTYKAILEGYGLTMVGIDEALISPTTKP